MGAELFHADKAGRHIQAERKKGRKMDGPTDIRDLMFALGGGGNFERASKNSTLLLKERRIIRSIM